MKSGNRIRDIILTFVAIGGVFLWMFDPKVNFLAAFGFGLIGSVYFAFAKSEPTRGF
jgi:hypothetical protein